MDYDYRNKSGASYARPMYGPPSISPSPPSTHPMYGYPNIGQQSGHGHQFFPPPERNQSFQHNSSPSPFSSSCKISNLVNFDFEFGFVAIWYLVISCWVAGLGIKVTLKPEYRITPPVRILILIFKVSIFNSVGGDWSSVSETFSSQFVMFSASVVASSWRYSS